MRTCKRRISSTHKTKVRLTKLELERSEEMAVNLGLVLAAMLAGSAVLVSFALHKIEEGELRQVLPIPRVGGQSTNYIRAHTIASLHIMTSVSREPQTCLETDIILFEQKLSAIQPNLKLHAHSLVSRSQTLSHTCTRRSPQAKLPR